MSFRFELSAEALASDLQFLCFAVFWDVAVFVASVLAGLVGLQL